MKRILVVNVNWVGDVIFSSPIFRALKDAYPGVKIACLLPPRVKGVAEHISGLDEIIVYDDKNVHRWPLGKLRLVSQIRKQKFDAAFILHRSLTRALLVFLSGIPIRVGYNTKGRGFLLTHKVKGKKAHVHRSDYYLNVIESLGVQIKDRTTRLTPDVNALSTIEKFLVENEINSGDHVVVINPGGNWDLKRWPVDRWSLLVSKLSKQNGMKIIVCGAEKDLGLAQEICSVDNSVLNFAGKTDFNLLLALMKRADVVVSADSGPLHIASSVGTDVVAIFGPTVPDITGPIGPGEKKILRRDIGCNSSVCYYLDCNDNICMQAITINDVVDAVLELKAKKKNENR